MLLQHHLSPNNPGSDVLEMRSRRIGDYTHLTAHHLQFVPAQNCGSKETIVIETVVARPNDFHPASLVLMFEVSLLCNAGC